MKKLVISAVNSRDQVLGGNKGQKNDHYRIPTEEAYTRDVNATGEAFPVDTSPALASFIQGYSSTGLPIQVSFRKLVPWLKVGERATHYIHPYPAKLLPHIAHFFLAARAFVKSDALVLDPFGGTGSVALETVLSGRTAVYADVNPLARLIASVKTCPIAESFLIATMGQIEGRYKKSRAKKPPEVVNIALWYDVEVIRQLTRLKSSIEVVDDLTVRAFFEIAFSAVCRRVSNADPRFSVPVRKKITGDQTCEPANVWAVFAQQFLNNLERMRELSAFTTGLGVAHCVGEDARNLKLPDKSGPLPDSSVGLVLTSPPYAGAQKYVRASSLSLGWLRLATRAGLRDLEGRTIGREHYRRDATIELPLTGVASADLFLKTVFQKNRTRAIIAATYLIEMRVAFQEAVRALREGGYFVLVIGDNQICGETFRSSEYLCEILESLGLKLKFKLVDRIPSRILMTKRAQSASVITCEWVVLFHKAVQ